MKHPYLKKPVAILLSMVLAISPALSLAADKKISEMDSGSTVQVTDQIAAVRAGANVRVVVNSAATQPSSAFLSSTGTIPPASLPAPAASTLGGVQAATPTANQFLTGIGTDGIPTKAQPSFSNISGTLAAAQLPNPSASTLGGVQSAAAVAHQFVTSITTLGVPVLAQPAVTDLSGIGTPTGTGNLAFSASPTFTGTVNMAGLSTTGATTFGALAGTGTRCVDVTASGTLSVAAADCNTGGGGSVSVTSSSNDILVNPSPGTGTFTVGSQNLLNAQGTAASYTVLASDIAKTITHNKSTSVAVTVPQAGTTGFEAGKGFADLNLGAGPATLTASGTSTINGAASITIHKGGWGFLFSDSSNNYNAVGFPGFDTIATNTLTKYSDISGALTTSGITDTGTTITFGENAVATGTMTLSGISGSTQCLHVNSSGLITGTGSDCGAGGSGVSSVNSLTGAITLAAGSNVTLTPSGNTITIAASSSASTNLGSSVSAASPQISGDATTGLYTSGAAKVDVAISGSKTFEWGSTGATNTGTFTTTGAETNSTTGVAGTPNLLMSGAVATGTATTALADVLVQPTGATAATDWATGGTAYGVNAASGFNGNFIDFHLNGGTSLFKVAATGNVTTTSAGAYIFASRSKMSSPVDGQILFQNNAASGLTGVKLGGTTSSFPYWKVNGTATNFRLADDSADAAITAANVTSSSAFISGGTKFTTSGCSISSTTGGATAGKMTSGTTGTCTVVITLPTAPNGWHCAASNRTAKTMLPTTADSATSCTIEGTTTTGDVISFLAMAY